MIGLAKRLNVLFDGRKGRLFEDRFHDRQVKTPRKAHAALQYVLGNARRHAAQGDGGGPVTATSGGAVTCLPTSRFPFRSTYRPLDLLAPDRG